MPVYSVERKNRIQVQFSDDELTAIQEMAKSDGDLTLSEYIRVAVMCDAFFSGNKTAWKLTFRGASRMARDLFRRKLKLRDKDVSKVI